MLVAVASGGEPVGRVVLETPVDLVGEEREPQLLGEPTATRSKVDRDISVPVGLWGWLM